MFLRNPGVDRPLVQPGEVNTISLLTQLALLHVELSIAFLRKESASKSQWLGIFFSLADAFPLHPSPAIRGTNHLLQIERCWTESFKERLEAFSLSWLLFMLCCFLDIHLKSDCASLFIHLYAFSNF